VRRGSPAAIVALSCALAVAACGVTTGEPSPTPTDILGIAAILRDHGITASRFVSGDAGCSDRDLTQLAVGIDAVGLDQATPTRVHFYLFRNKAVYDRLRPAIDACAISFVTDPADFGLIEAPPYVAAGPGPWATEFNAALRASLTEAIGDRK
jgi:hypothetical protein